MSEQKPKVSRWVHFRAWLSRQSRGRRKDTIAIIVLALAGIVMTLGIFTQQKASLPSWLPLVGEDFDHITADFTTAQAVTPGQGQAVDIAGIQIGKVTSVDLEDGHAVVGMDIEPKYLELIHPDANLLLRPKTNLNDMIVEIDPGIGKKHDRRRRPLPPRADRTEHQPRRLPRHPRRRHPPVPPAARRRRRPGHRRPRPAALATPSAASSPSSTTSAKLNRAVAQRHVALANVIHNFGLLTTELGRHDAEIERFVTSSKDALGNFANQQAVDPGIAGRVPLHAAAGNAGLASSKRFSDVAYPALIGADPAGAGVGAGLQGHRAALQPDDGADPRPDPALHPRRSGPC